MIERDEIDDAISILNGLNHVREAALLTGLLYVADQVSALRDDLDRRELDLEQRHLDLLGALEPRATTSEQVSPWLIVPPEPEEPPTTEGEK